MNIFWAETWGEPQKVLYQKKNTLILGSQSKTVQGKSGNRGNRSLPRGNKELVLIQESGL